MIQVNGKAGIYAKILADSISPQGVRLTTYEVSYPRIIHSELMTHGMLPKNAASSRAIPFAKMKEQLTGCPVRFGANQSGMQDKGKDFNALVGGMPPAVAWEHAQERATMFAEAFFEAGYHKQVYNRLTEPFQMMKTVLSGTEFNNFFWLRDDGAADPTIAELARCMQEAREQSVPMLLQPGEWHLPYVWKARDENGELLYGIETDETYQYEVLKLEDAKKVSAARCAAVSFRNVDYTLDKSIEVYERLLGADRKHASAFCHQATPMKPCPGEEERGGNIPGIPETWQEGISHADRQGQLWSAQFKGWVMFRKLIPGENKEG